MIQLECSNCKTMLSIDDAFAGGVCRCQYCGTIQTVPKPSSKAAQTAADAASPKALFKRKARIESALSPYNDDLDRAADQMESSGPLSPNALSGLSGPPKRSAAPTSPGESRVGSGSVAGSPLGGSQAGTPSPRRASGASTAGGIASATVTRTAATAAPVLVPEPPVQETPAPAQSQAAGKPHYVPKPSTAATAAQGGKSNKMPLIIAAAAVGVLVCGGGAWLALSSGSKPAPQATPQVTPALPALPAPEPQPAQTAVKDPVPVPAPAPVAVPAPVPVAQPAPAVTVAAEPAVPAPVAAAPVVVIGEPGSFAGISLAGTSVVYILDRNGCTPEAFGQMLDACYASIQSLGEGRKFAVVVWNNQQELAFPAQELVAASAANLEECRKALAETSAGVTDVSPILARAVAAQAEDIVLVSATDMDDLTAMSIRDQLAKAGAPVRFHGVAVGTALGAERLKPLVADYKGQFKQLDATALK